MTEIAESLASGNPVHVICGPEGYVSANVDSANNLNENIRINRVRITNWDKNKVFSRILRLIMLTLKMAAKIYREGRPGDKVLMVTNPAPLLLLMARICKWKKIKLVIIVHDVFPENLRAANMIKASSPVYKVLLYLFNAAYRSADLLLVLGRDMKKILAAKTGLPSESIKIIENWADIEKVYPLENFHQGPLKLQFAGNFGRVQGLIPLLEAINASNNNKMMIEFIGHGAVLDEMKAYVDQQKLLNVRILLPFNRSEQLSILNNCDISVVSLAPGMAGLGVPSKAYNILAAGKPVLFIGDRNSEIALLIKENNIGWVFPDFGAELIAFLKQLNPSFRDQIKDKGHTARKLAEEKYAKSIILYSYKIAIETV